MSTRWQLDCSRCQIPLAIASFPVATRLLATLGARSPTTPGILTLTLALVLVFLIGLVSTLSPLAALLFVALTTLVAFAIPRFTATLIRVSAAPLIATLSTATLIATLGFVVRHVLLPVDVMRQTHIAAYRHTSTRDITRKA